MSDNTETGIVKQETKKPPLPMNVGNAGGLQLTTLDEMWRFATALSKSKFAPKDMSDPESLLIAIQMGLELGITPMQAVQNIAVINGRPAIYGDLVPGLVKGSGKQEYYKQEEIGKDGTDSYGFRITSKRRGEPNPVVTEFTIADAKKAGLWGKAGVWSQYPKRMILNRARTFNARDNFPDVLKGIHTREEMEDAQFEIIEDTPLEDGDKTTNLAQKLADAEDAEVEVSDVKEDVVDEETGEVIEPAPESTEPSPEPVVDWGKALKEEMKFRKTTELKEAAEACGIKKPLASYTQKDAEKIMNYWKENDNAKNS